MTLNELVKLTTLWTTGPCYFCIETYLADNPKNDLNEYPQDNANQAMQEQQTTTIFSIGLDKRGYQEKYFSYFLMKTYVVGTH